MEPWAWDLPLEPQSVPSQDSGDSRDSGSSGEQKSVFFDRGYEPDSHHENERDAYIGSAKSIVVKNTRMTQSQSDQIAAPEGLLEAEDFKQILLDPRPNTERIDMDRVKTDALLDAARAFDYAQKEALAAVMINEQRLADLLLL